jgi:hypothetical protein
MRRALTYSIVMALLCAPGTAAPRKSWNKIRYLGGTVHTKTSSYDWNTILTVNPDSIVLVIARATLFTPQQTVSIKPSQVTSLSYGQAAWRQIGEVSGAQLPAKPPLLFGLLRTDFQFMGIIYQTEDGKRAALLLQSTFSSQILIVLQTLTGKTIESFP